MTCPSCGSDNRARRKFCGACGTELVRACPACGSVNEPEDAFCGECGASLASSGPATTSATEPPAVGAASPRPASPRPPASGPELRHVSVLFCDLVGFTPFSEKRDPEEVRELL